DYFTPCTKAKTGQHLFTINQRPLQAALSQAQANVMKATAAIRQGQDIVAKNETTDRNLRTIAKRDNVLGDEAVVSREEDDTGVSAADAADATVRADQSYVSDLQAAVKAEQATVEIAKVQLSYETIKAPVSGKTGNLAVASG